MNKTMLAILKILEKYSDIVGSREISRQLKLHGIDLTERTVRYHLRILDERGYTEVFGKEGRKITGKGRQELKHALVSEKIGFVISKIETLSYQTTLDLKTLDGDVILNISYFPEFCKSLTCRQGTEPSSLSRRASARLCRKSPGLLEGESWKSHSARIPLSPALLSSCSFILSDSGRFIYVSN